MFQIPTIETERLILRELRLGDADTYGNIIFGDAEVMRYMNADGNPATNPRMTALGYIMARNKQWDERGFGAWGLVEKATGRFAGHVGLFTVENTDAIELGYALGQQFWGYGYAVEAGREALRYGFYSAQLDEIIAVAFPQNANSVRVMQKLGMRSKGITDQYYNLSLVCYVLTRAEFEKL